MLLKNMIIITFITICVLLIFETIGREHNITCIRVSQLIIPLSYNSVELWKKIGKYTAKLSGEPLLCLWYNLSNLTTYYLKEFYYSILELFLPIIKLLISPIYIFNGYYNEVKVDVLYYTSDI